MGSSTWRLTTRSPLTKAAAGGRGHQGDAQDHGLHRLPPWAAAATSRTPFICECPLPQYSEQLMEKEPGCPGDEFHRHRLAALRHRLCDLQLLDREPVRAISRLDGDAHGVALVHFDAVWRELVAFRHHRDLLHSGPRAGTRRRMPGSSCHAGKESCGRCRALPRTCRHAFVPPSGGHGQQNGNGDASNESRVLFEERAGRLGAGTRGRYRRGKDLRGA